MMRLILINTQEWLRLKFLQIVVFLCFFYFFVSYLMGSLSFTEQQRLLFDFGLAGIELTTVFIASFISTHALFREIDRKTILVLLSRPIPRWHLLIGYLGSLAILNLILIFVLGGSLFFFLEDTHFTSAYVVSLFTIYLKSINVAAFGLFVAVLARPMFAFVLALTYWVAGYSLPDLMFFAKKLNHSGLKFFSQVFEFIIPNFYRSNWKNYLFLKSDINWNDVSWVLFHYSAWIAVLFVASAWAFRRKEIV